MADDDDANDAELLAVYGKHADPLWELASRLDIPPAEAGPLIRDAMFASLLRKGGLDLDAFLAASLRLAAKRRAERAQ